MELFGKILKINLILLIINYKLAKCDCDIDAIKRDCYDKINKEWPVTNKTDQPVKRICCWHWDVFDCVELASCDQCSTQQSQDIQREYNHLKDNLMNKTCVHYGYGSNKCHLTLGFYALCFYGICFLISIIYLIISYGKRLKMNSN